MPGWQDDDGFTLYDSYEIRAISRYLAKKYTDQGPALLPTELKTLIVKVVGELLRKPHRGLSVDQAVLAEFSRNSTFPAGDEFTFADLFHFSYAPMLADNGVDIMTSKGPKVTWCWWNELISRPAWVKLKRRA
ncbi:hypothetical protein B0H13DRAFT_2335329 [Mycena leptocephala]|nr:hypothetical protein B0H13DRAFT_2335329 [Mycena leptocephala]